MKVLVTGGAGFIGSQLVERLLQLGQHVRVLDNFSTGHRANLAGFADDIDVVEGDIQSYERVHNAVRGCDAVLHQAALPSVPRSIADPLTSHATNATGTLNVLLAARDEDVRRLVFASSSSVYGAVEGLPKRETMPTMPISPYGTAKLAAESYCRSFHEVYGLETVALRYFNVFGPRQDPNSEYAAVIPKFIAAYAAGRAPTIYGDGEQSRDFTYVDNIVDANLAALDAPGVSGRVFNVACGERITLNHLASELRAEMGVDVEPTHGPARPGDILHSLADVQRAREELGYEPRIGFSEGLRRTLEYFAQGSSATTAGCTA
ncbi:MAG: SDR family oxidoreductase [Solirubrobacteraceae bacterium]